MMNNKSRDRTSEVKYRHFPFQTVTSKVNWNSIEIMSIITQKIVKQTGPLLVSPCPENTIEDEFFNCRHRAVDIKLKPSTIRKARVLTSDGYRYECPLSTDPHNGKCYTPCPSGFIREAQMVYRKRGTQGDIVTSHEARSITCGDGRIKVGDVCFNQLCPRGYSPFDESLTTCIKD